jgi:hypothetical protein
LKDRDKIQGEREDYTKTIEYFMHRIQEYCVVFSEGKYFIYETREPITRSHMACLLRRDYLQNSGGNLRGALLCKAIDIFLRNSEKALEDAMENSEDPEIKKHIKPW